MTSYTDDEIFLAEAQQKIDVRVNAIEVVRLFRSIVAMYLADCAIYTKKRGDHSLRE